MSALSCLVDDNGSVLFRKWINVVYRHNCCVCCCRAVAEKRATLWRTQG